MAPRAARSRAKCVTRAPFPWSPSASRWRSPAGVDDIRHIGDYLATFRAAGCTPVRRLDSAVAGFAWTLMSFGAMRSGAWLVRKGA